MKNKILCLIQQLESYNFYFPGRISSKYRLVHPILQKNSTKFAKLTTQKTLVRLNTFSTCSGRNRENVFLQCHTKLPESSRKGRSIGASSAVAAKLIESGRNAHSTFKISLLNGAEDTCHRSVDFGDTQKLQGLALIIQDVIKLCHCYCIEALDLTLKDNKRYTVPFCVKVLLFCWRLPNVLPLVPSSSRVNIFNACVRSSFPQHCLHTVFLKENKKLQLLFQYSGASEEGLQLPCILLRTGEGNVSADVSSHIKVSHYLYKACCRENLCDYIYKDIEEKQSDEDQLNIRAAITTQNISLQSINQIVGSEHLGPAVTCTSGDNVGPNENIEDGSQYPV